MYKRRCSSESKAAKEKRNFRQRKVFKDFKETMRKLSLGLDFITQSKLREGWNLHHKDLDPDNYEILSPERFACLNNQTHEMVHWAFRYYVKDPQFIDRLQSVLEDMRKYHLEAELKNNK